MRDFFTFITLFLFISVTIIGLVLTGAYWRASHEAKQFTALTGKEVSTTDAFFLDLVVMETTLEWATVERTHMPRKTVDFDTLIAGLTYLETRKLAGMAMEVLEPSDLYEEILKALDTDHQYELITHLERADEARRRAECVVIVHDLNIDLSVEPQ